MVAEPAQHLAHQPTPERCWPGCPHDNPQLADLAGALGMELDWVPKRDDDHGGHIIPMWMRRAAGLGPLTPAAAAQALRLGAAGERLLAAALAVAQHPTGAAADALAEALETYGLW